MAEFNLKEPVPNISYVNTNLVVAMVAQREKTLKMTKYNRFSFPLGVETIDLLCHETSYSAKSLVDSVPNEPYHFIDWSNDVESWQIVQDIDRTSCCEITTIECIPDLSGLTYHTKKNWEP